MLVTGRDPLVCQILRQNEDVSGFIPFQHLRPDIGVVRTHGQGFVRSQGPGGRRPCQEIFIIPVRSLELHSQCVDLHCLISLSDLVGGKSGSAARAVRLDLVTFIDHILLEELVDDPPDRLNIIVVQGDVRVIHVRQIAGTFTHISPHIREGEYRFPALLIEFLDSVFLNVLLSAHAQVLLHLDLHRKSVGIPAGPGCDLEALHPLIAVDGILQCTGHHMVNARLAVRCRRSLEENELRSAFPCFRTFRQQIIVFPFLDLCLLYLGNRLV